MQPVPVSILCLSLLLSGCAVFSNGQRGLATQGAASKLSQAMSGRFASEPDENGNRVEDFRTGIKAMGKGEWIYFQRNQGEKLGTAARAYRQRVLQLVNRPDGGVDQITWSLKAPALYASAPRHPGILKALDKKALKLTMEDGCEQNWTYDSTIDQGGTWRGRVNPEACTIFSKRRAKRIGIGSETRLSAEGLREAERGFDLNGTQLWGTPAGDFTDMKRVE